MKSSVMLFKTFLSVTYFAGLVTSYPDYVMPVPGDCTKYQVCDYSGCFVFNCGIGTEFNPRISVCDYPLRDRGECGGRIYPGVARPTIPISQGPSYSYPPSQGPSYSYPPPQGPSYPNSGGQLPGYPYPGNQGPSYSGQGPPGYGVPGSQGPPGYPTSGYQNANCAYPTNNV